MKIRFLLLYIMLLSVLMACFKSVNKDELKKKLESDDKTKIIEALDYISDVGDTTMVKDILKHSFDPRITHILVHKGMSVYQIKMGVMKKLTGILPPNKVTAEPDSVNIKFYLKVATTRGWIR